MKKSSRKPRKPKQIDTVVHMLIAALIGTTLEGAVQIEGIAITTFVVYPVLLMVYRARK